MSFVVLAVFGLIMGISLGVIASIPYETAIGVFKTPMGMALPWAIVLTLAAAIVWVMLTDFGVSSSLAVWLHLLVVVAAALLSGTLVRQAMRKRHRNK